MSAPEWDLANCRGKDTEIFFPVAANQDVWAKRICSGCEIRQGCLDWSIDSAQQFGIWGGLTEEERRAEARYRNGWSGHRAADKRRAQRYERAAELHKAGLPVFAIARELHITVQTVERYLSKVQRTTS